MWVVCHNQVITGLLHRHSVGGLFVKFSTSDSSNLDDSHLKVICRLRTTVLSIDIMYRIAEWIPMNISWKTCASVALHTI